MEEEFKPILCIVCLNVKTNENCTVVEESIRNALDVLRLELPTEEIDKSMMICNTCCTKVFEAFRFKTTCMDTEDSIFPYVTSKNGTPVDLKEIYLKEKDKEQLGSVSEDERICRLCMQIVTSRFTSIKDIDIDLIRICVPEVNFNFTEEPVVCPTCLESLKRHSVFLRNCFGFQNHESVSDQATEDESCIKTEETEIKSENSGCSETPFPEDEPSDIETEAEDIPKSHKYACDTCGYQTNAKISLTNHQLKHKPLSEVTAYECDVCNFKTNHKGSLTHHLSASHHDAWEAYMCDICNYATTRKDTFARHQLTHRSTSATPVYKCDICNYQTRGVSFLNRHRLAHNKVCVTEKYKCDKCDFETKYRTSHIKHQLKHKDVSEVQMHKCDMCNFGTKYKQSLVNHKLKHKDNSEVFMYSCDECNFESKHKYSLVKHRKKHGQV